MSKDFDPPRGDAMLSLVTLKMPITVTWFAATLLRAACCRRSFPLTVCLLALLSSPALSFHATDLEERVVMGADLLPSGPARGGFVAGSRGLVLDEPLAHGWNYILDKSEITDGFIRARFVAGTRLDVSVLVRAAVGKDARALDAIGVSIEGGRRPAFVAYRFDRGVARPIARPVPIVIDAGRALELTVTFVGPQFTAHLVDDDSLEVLATLTFTDDGRAAGAVGLRVHSRQDRASRLRALSVRAAGTPLSATRQIPPGIERLVVIPKSHLKSVDRALTSSRFVDGERAYLLTDRVGHERMKRMGVPIIESRGEPGWWFSDKSMREAKKRGVRNTRRGVSMADSYKDAEMVEAFVRAVAARFPDITHLEEIGTSLEGRPLLALKISDNAKEREDEPAVIFNAAHHGSELMSQSFALDAIVWLTERYKRDRQVRRWVDDMEIWFVPMVNPDGNMHYVHGSRAGGRKNARDLDGDGVFEAFEGVDLNRNYPFRWGALGEVGSRSFGPHSKYRGTAPATEPEVVALMSLYVREKPAASISFHTAATKVLTPYTIDGVKNPVPDVALTIAEELVVDLPVQTSRKKYEVARNLYSVDGTDQDWMFHENGTIALLVEGPLHNTRSSRLRKRSVERTRPTWQRLLERVRSGPRVFGRVLSTSGRALDAVVRLKEHRTFEGERWTARAVDGRFDRMLDAPSTVTVVVEKDGYQKFEKRVRVRGPKRVDITLLEEES